MIVWEEIPQIPGDMDVLAGHARGLQTTGAGLADTGARVHATWQGLAAHHVAPEADQLFAATAPVQAVAGSVGEDVGVIGGALGVYADTVRPIQARLTELRSSAQAFTTGVPEGWQSDTALVERHEELLTGVRMAVAQWWDAQRACANAILALYSGMRYRADDADGVTEADELGFTAEQLGRVLDDGQVLPWGGSEEQDHGFLGDVWAGFGGFFVDGLWGDVVGLGGLVGISGAGLSWETAGESWGALGQLTIIPSLDDMWRGEMTPLDAAGRMYGNWGTLLGGLIALDQWEHNPGGAVGQVLYNVVTLPIAFTKILRPVVTANRAGDAGHAAGAAADAGRLARLRASMVDGLNRMPTVDEIVRNVGDRLNIHPPRLGPVPAIVGDGGGVVRFDVDTPEARGSDGGHPAVSGKPDMEANATTVESGTSADLPRRPVDPALPHGEMTPAERSALDRRQDQAIRRESAQYDEWRLNDPAHRGRSGRNQDLEARIALDMRERGELPAGVTRPDAPTDGDFIDPTTGRKWDIKGFYSDWPDHVPVEKRSGGFPSAVTPERFRASVADELELSSW